MRVRVPLPRLTNNGSLTIVSGSASVAKREEERKPGIQTHPRRKVIFNRFFRQKACRRREASPRRTREERPGWMPRRFCCFVAYCLRSYKVAFRVRSPASHQPRHTYNMDRKTLTGAVRCVLYAAALLMIFDDPPETVLSGAFCAVKATGYSLFAALVWGRRTKALYKKP